MGRIAIGEGDTESCIGKQSDIDNLVEKKMFNHFILAEGETSFKNIIMLIKKYKGKLSFLIHAKGSRSIVGSNSKNEKGIFITEELKPADFSSTR